MPSPATAPTPARVGPRGGRLAAPWTIGAASALVALLAAALARGRVHPDEVFQVLEPANGIAFGTWWQAWEWQEGLRNWAVPGILGGLLELLAALGVRHPWALVAAVWTLCAAVQACGTVALHHLVEERDGRSAAALAAWVHATWGGWAIFAARPIGDALSVAPLLGALWFAWRAQQRGGGADGLRAGALLGLAFVARYPSAIFALPVAASLLWARRWRALALTAAGGLAVLAALALLDQATWGHPLHSALKHTAFNLSGGSERFGTRPWWSYGPIFAGMAPLLLAYHFARGLGRRDLLAGAFATYFAAVNLLAHKEPRFLVPLLPLYAAIAAGPAVCDLDRLRQRLGRAAVAGAAGLYALSSVAAATVQLPFGLYTDLLDAWVEVGRDPSLRGLLGGMAWWQSGGRFYLGRDVPVAFTYRLPAAEVEAMLADRSWTHAVVWEDDMAPDELEAAGFQPERRSKRVTIWRRAR